MYGGLYQHTRVVLYIYPRWINIQNYCIIVSDALKNAKWGQNLRCWFIVLYHIIHEIKFTPSLICSRHDTLLNKLNFPMSIHTLIQQQIPNKYHLFTLCGCPEGEHLWQGACPRPSVDPNSGPNEDLIHNP